MEHSALDQSMFTHNRVHHDSPYRIHQGGEGQAPKTQSALITRQVTFRLQQMARSYPGDPAIHFTAVNHTPRSPLHVLVVRKAYNRYH